jgi:hypothetical protein
MAIWTAKFTAAPRNLTPPQIFCTRKKIKGVVHGGAIFLLAETQLNYDGHEKIGWQA